MKTDTIKVGTLVYRGDRKLIGVVKKIKNVDELRYHIHWFCDENLSIDYSEVATRTYADNFKFFERISNAN